METDFASPSSLQRLVDIPRCTTKEEILYGLLFQIESDFYGRRTEGKSVRWDRVLEKHLE